MTELDNKDSPTIISSEDARGALGGKSVTLGDTLLPMLIGGLVLALISVGVAYAVWPTITP
jgi:hypothetical protein